MKKVRCLLQTENVMEDIKKMPINWDTKCKHGCKMYYKLALSYNCVRFVPYTLKTVR